MSADPAPVIQANEEMIRVRDNAFRGLDREQFRDWCEEVLTGGRRTLFDIPFIQRERN